MRWGLAAGATALLLAGCGNSFDTGPTTISVEVPAGATDQGMAQAEAQCKAYGKAAKLKEVQTSNAVQVGVYDCQ